MLKGDPLRAEPTTKAPLPTESIRAQVEKILACQSFAEAERLRRFLRFTVDLTLEGKGSQIKEYLLGVEGTDGGNRSIVAAIRFVF